jgi:pentatricopeptide repeat protein
MRPARFAHVAIRTPLKRPQPNTKYRAHRLFTSNRLQSSSASQNGTLNKWEKRKTEFNENAGWDGFLDGSGQVAKEPRELAEDHLKSAIEKEAVDGEDENQAFTVRGRPAANLDEAPAPPWRLASDDVELVSSNQDRAAADRHEVARPLEDEALARLAQLERRNPTQKAEENAAAPDRDPNPYRGGLLRYFTQERREMFVSNHERLIGAAMIPLEEIQWEDSLIPLPRNLETGDFYNLDFNWLRNYAVLFARRLHPHAEDLDPVILPRTRRQFAALVRQMRQSELEDPNDRIRAAVNQIVDMHAGNFRRVWPDFMLLIMRYMPDMSTGFLQASYTHVKPPFYMVADTIHFAARFCLSDPKSQGRGVARDAFTTKLMPNDIVELILDIIPQCNLENTFIHDGTIARLSEVLDLQTGYSLFAGLRAFDSRIRSWSCIVFAHFFARHGEYETALEALELYLDNGGSSEELKFKKAASKILRWSIIHPQGYHDSGHIISRFMDMGLKIGLFFQTTLIANAFDSKDAPTALNVFSLMREQGIEPDAQTYATMLKGLRHSEDEALNDDILGLSWAKVEEMKDEWLAGEALFWHYAKRVQKAEKTWEKEEKAKIQQEALQQLVSLYTTIFDRAPLDVLGFSQLVPLEKWSPSTSLGIKPTPFIMSVMILAYTRAMVLLMEDQDAAPRKVGTNYRMYQRWWHVATRWTLYPEIDQWVKDLFIEMMKTPHVFNIFMHALGAQPATLYRAITILQRMDTGTVGITTSSAETDLIEPVAAPNIFSWSILLNAFARHGQTEAAEKCMETMQSKNIYPDEVVWNTLVKAYAVKQHPEGVVSALRRKEEAGFGMDRGVVRVLTRMKDHDTLKALLRREVRYRESGISDEKLLGRAEEKGKKERKYLTYKWRPGDEEAVGYEPGVGKRQVQYFDANRTMGLHKEAWTVMEEEDVGYEPMGPGGGTPVLDGRGSFALKSEKEEDWFEDDEVVEGGGDEEFGVSPMDDVSRRRQ